MKLKIVNAGCFMIDAQGTVKHLKNYAMLYNKLVNEFDEVTVFSGYLKEHETGANFLNDIPISKSVKLVLTKGNSANTKSFSLLLNYLVLSIKLLRFCLGKNNYLVFMPSPTGLISLIFLFLFNNKSNIGLYIGGNYAQEQAHSKRNGHIRRLFVKPFGKLINYVQNMALKKADYVLTTCYDLYYKNRDQNAKIQLASPLINVSENAITYKIIKKSKKIVITYCGELRRQKGCIDLLLAFRFLLLNRLYTRSDKLILRYIGDGECYQELINITKASLILNKKVEFIGHIKEKEKLINIFRDSALFVLPSYSEGFPRVAYEQFLIGVPTILSRVGGIPFLIKENKESVFVKPGDIREIANKMGFMLSNKKFRKKIVRNAKELMKNEVFPRIKQNGLLEEQIQKLIIMTNM